MTVMTRSRAGAPVARNDVSIRAVRGRTVVLLDDTQVHARHLSALLEDEGATVRVFDDVVEAAMSLGLLGADAVVVSWRCSDQEIERVVEVVREVLSIPVLVALGPISRPAVDRAVLAGAVPVLDLAHQVEVLGRVLRETPTPDAEEVVQVGGLTVDRARHDVHLNGTALDLSVIELSILYRLATTADHVVDRHDLARTLWPQVACPENTLVAAVARVRRKLALVSASEAIETVRGVGYRLSSSRLRAA